MAETDTVSESGSPGTVDDEREILVSDDPRIGLPLNRYGERVFTSADGPMLGNFQRDTLDVIREERAQAKWKLNPLDLQPGVDPSILDDVTDIDETKKSNLDRQAPRKQTGESYAERGHHPEWTDARRNQQAGFWGSYTPSVAASRATIPNVADIANSCSVYSFVNQSYTYIYISYCFLLTMFVRSVKVSD